MKHLFALLSCLLLAASISAQTFTFTSADPQTIGGVTVSFAQGSGNNAPAYFSNGLRLYANNTITISGASITSISATFAKQGTKAFASLSANCGTLVSGGESTATDAPVTDTWTGTATTVVLTVGPSGQRLIQQIIVNGSTDTIPSDTTIVTPPADTTVVVPTGDTLQPGYTYGEPTTIVTPGAGASKTAIRFVQNNILVECTQGALYDDYFSCYAGASITFTASQPITALAANAFLKKDFAATASAGNLEYIDASEDTISGNPALIVHSINANSITLTCVKQIRFYSVDFYFGAEPELELDEPAGGYSYSWEPDSISSLSFAFDSLEYIDMSDNLGYPCSYLHFVSDDAEAAIVVFSAISATILPYGSYPVDSTYADGTVQASVGGDEFYDYESYLATNFVTIGGVDYYDPYYIVSGTLTVAEAATPGQVEISLNATSAKGSTIHFTYVGHISEETALTTIEAAGPATKTLRDGQLIILRDGRHFNALGQRVR